MMTTLKRTGRIVLVVLTATWARSGDATGHRNEDVQKPRDDFLSLKNRELALLGNTGFGQHSEGQNKHNVDHGVLACTQTNFVFSDPCRGDCHFLEDPLESRWCSRESLIALGMEANEEACFCDSGANADTVCACCCEKAASVLSDAECSIALDNLYATAERGETAFCNGYELLMEKCGGVGDVCDRWRSFANDHPVVMYRTRCGYYDFWAKLESGFCGIPYNDADGVWSDPIDPGDGEADGNTANVSVVAMVIVGLCGMATLVYFSGGASIVHKCIRVSRGMLEQDPVAAATPVGEGGGSTTEGRVRSRLRSRSSTGVAALSMEGVAGEGGGGGSASAVATPVDATSVEIMEITPGPPQLLDATLCSHEVRPANISAIIAEDGEGTSDDRGGHGGGDSEGDAAGRETTETGVGSS